MLVSGVGGTGKSFLIETIDQPTSEIWPSDGMTCAIAAPTGLAAFNVGGMTLHRLFQLPIEHEGKPSMYWPLPKASHKVMKMTLHDVKLLIVDKVSMVSSLTLAYVHLRLEANRTGLAPRTSGLLESSFNCSQSMDSLKRSRVRP